MAMKPITINARTVTDTDAPSTWTCGQCGADVTAEGWNAHLLATGHDDFIRTPAAAR